MNNEKWQKGIGDLKNIKLSKEERALVYNKIMERSPYTTIKRPYLSFVSRHYALVVATVLIFIISGNVIVEAEGALPGNTLYAMKINVTEPLIGLTKLKPEEKIAWQVEKATRRIEEAETLAVQNNLDDKKRDEIEKLFKKSISKFDNNLSKIATSSQNSKVAEIESKLNQRVSAHSKVVEKVNEKKSKENGNELNLFEKTITSTVQKIEDDNKLSTSTADKKEETKKVKEIVEKRLKELEKERQKIEKIRENSKKIRDEIRDRSSAKED